MDTSNKINAHLDAGLHISLSDDFLKSLDFILEEDGWGGEADRIISGSASNKKNEEWGTIQPSKNGSGSLEISMDDVMRFDDMQDAEALTWSAELKSHTMAYRQSRPGQQWDNGAPIPQVSNHSIEDFSNSATSSSSRPHKKRATDITETHEYNAALKKLAESMKRSEDSRRHVMEQRKLLPPEQQRALAMAREQLKEQNEHAFQQPKSSSSVTSLFPACASRDALAKGILRGKKHISTYTSFERL